MCRKVSSTGFQLMIVIFFALNCFAQTEIPAGNVSGLWLKANSPYRVNGEITIPNGETLTIEPGVNVIFTGHYKFNVQGRLLATGTATDSITFTAQDPETGWHGIRFRNTPKSNDSSKIVFCVLRYGKAYTGDYIDQSGGAISIVSFNKVLISHCLFDSNMTGGSISTSGGGCIDIEFASPTITHCEFKANQSAYGAAMTIYNTSGGLICNNHFHDNIGHGLINIGGGSAPILMNNLIENNHSNQHGIIHFEGGSGRAIFINNTIVNNNCGGGAIWESDGSTTLFINNIIYGNEPAQVRLEAPAGLDFINCLIEGGRDGFTGAAFTGAYQDCIDSDPVFMSSNDFHLQDESPCISAGCDSIQIGKKWHYAPAYDFERNPRPNPPGSSPDLGAFESESGGPFIRYFSHILNDSGGNNNGRADAGETAKLTVTLKNTSLDAAGVSAVLASDDPDVRIIQAAADFDDLLKDQKSSNTNAPFTFSVSPSSIAHLSTFYLNITAEGEYRRAERFKILIGSPAILLVDDDRGKGYEAYFTKALEMKHIFAEVWNVSTDGSLTTDVLQKYQSVIWFTGDDRDSTLTGREQAVIAAFLDGGGKLLITGQDIGYDLVEDGSTEDSSFYAGYLHAKFVSDNSNSTSVRGINGDPITGSPSRMTLIFNGAYDAADNQTAPDVIFPISPAETILQYVPQKTDAALRYENKDTGCRLVYLAFGFEGISGPAEDSANQLIVNILAWLAGRPAPVEAYRMESIAPEAYSLSQNFPNPFNPSTSISYSTPKTGRVKLTVYDVNGRQVTVLVDETKTAGIHTVQFNASRLSSGVYFYRMETAGKVQSKKLMLMK